MPSPSYLILENGSIYPGISFGKDPLTVSDLRAGDFILHDTGEIVFNTAHSGYHEVLTDPSYTGQIVAMTYPHMGNYGADDSWSEGGPEGGRAVREVKAAGFVVRSLYRGPVPAGRISLDDYLRRHGITGISEIDTRRLTLELRESGSQRAVIIADPEPGATLNKSHYDQVLSYLKAFPSMEGCNLVGEVGIDKYVFQAADTKAPESHWKGLHVALLDCGSKANIVRELGKRGIALSIFPSTATAQEILAVKPQGVLVSNGPGDPAVLSGVIQTVRDLADRIPLTGICLGHQLISLALGAKTYKMKFGHHGINHPVRDELTKKVFVTSQNHGFAVDEESLPDNVDVWFRNANDQSIEGLISKKRRIACAQFHPESAPGPYDSLWIFDQFLDLMKTQ